MYRNDSPGEFEFLQRLLLIGTALGVGGWLLFGADPLPNPANENAFGCYVGRDAPSVLLSERGLQIPSTNIPDIGFSLTRGKLGIDMVIDRQIVPVREGAGYSLNPGSTHGYILKFVNFIDGQAYGQFDETRLNHFQIVGNDGTTLNYLRADPSNCQLMT